MDTQINFNDFIQFTLLAFVLIGGWWKLATIQRVKQGDIIEETKRRTIVEQQIKSIQARLDLADAADLEVRKDISNTLKSMDKKLGNIEGRLIHLESAEKHRSKNS